MSTDATGERPSMAELERELADLLDEAPLLPEDDDEGSGVDFVPPPHLPPRPESSPPPPADDAEPSVHADEVPAEVPPAEVPPAAPVAAMPVVPVAVVPVPAAPLAEPSVAAPEAREPRTVSALRDTTSEGEPKRAPPGVGKGTRALVTTLVIAALLVVGRFLTWPSETHQVRQSNTPGSTRVQPDRHVGAREAARADDPTPPAPQPVTVPTATTSPSGDTPATAPAEAVGPDGAPAFSVVDMLSALAPAGIEAGRCRHTGAPKGRAYVRVNIASGGQIESVFAGHAYKDSETADCIERKIRAAKLPPFSGAGGSVVLGVDLR